MRTKDFSSTLARHSHWLIRLVRFFGLRGSWKWACKQMDAGKIIRPSTATGYVEYRLDLEGQRRLQWRFGGEWENANFFLRDQEDTDWILSPNAQADL
jgi:hypothetical protein